MPKLLLIFLSSLFFSAGAQQANQYIFRHIDQHDGLLHNSVYTIAQDKQGFMWIGSRNGLQRYDGLRFTSYQQQMTPLSYSALILNLYADDKQNIWMNTTELASINTATKKLTVYDSSIISNPEFAFVTYTDGHNRPWLLSKYGLYYMDTLSKSMKLFSVSLPRHPSKTGYAICYDSLTNYTWVISRQGLLLFDPETKKVYSPDYNPKRNPVLKLFGQKNFSCLLIDKAKNFWLSTWEGELYKYDAATKKASSYSLQALSGAGLSSEKKRRVTVNCMYQDTKGFLWIGTDNTGLLRYNSSSDSFGFITAKDEAQQGVPFNYNFYCITEDRDGNLWLGTDKGITVFNPYRQYFQIITHQEGNKASLPKSEITSVMQAGNGDVYFATWGEGFSIYDSLLRFKKTVSPTGSYEFPLLWCFAEADDKMVWMGAQHGFVHLYNPANGTIKTIHPAEMENSTTRCMKKDASGNIWFGLHSGKIVKWDKGSNVFSAGTENPLVTNTNPVLNIFIDNQKRFWLSTDDGLLSLNPATGQLTGRYTIALPGNATKSATSLIRGIEQVNDSTLAIGTMRSGVYFFSTSSKKFFYHPSLLLLQNDNVYAIKRDSEQNLWISTDYQLYQLRAKDDKLISYKISPGLLSASFELLNFYSLHDSRWITSTLTEALIFDPAVVSHSGNVKKQVIVTGLSIFDHPVSIDSAFADGKPLRLTYDQNFISLQFTTLAYTGIDDNIFYYQLSGVDKEWVKGDGTGMAVYTNLSPGDYIFSVRAGNSSESSPVTAFTIIIAPPFWKTWWAISLMAFATGLLVYHYIKGREKNIKAVETQKLKVQRLNADQYRNKLEMEQIVNYFSSSLIAKNTVDDVLWDVAKNLIGRLGFEDCMMYLWNKDKTKMIQRAGYGPKGSIEEIANRHFDVVTGQGVVGYVMQTKEAVLIADTTKDPRYRVDEMVRQSEITVPIIYNDELIGVIDSEHQQKNFYTQQHVQVLSTIATLTANKLKSIESEQSLQQTKMEMLGINEKLSEARLDALRSQMNPHFIFNCLNAIDNLIQTAQTDKATTYLARFAKLIRSLLDSSKTNLVPFSKDIETLNLFLELEQFRCDNKFSYELQADNELLYGDYKVPPLIVQPFAENAIHHGLLNKQEGERKLLIRASLNDGYIQYTVTDNGVGRAKAMALKTLNKPEHISYGIEITEERIRLHNQNGAGGDVIFTDLFEGGLPSGTKVVVKLKADH